MSSAPSVRESEWTIGRLLNWTTDYLARHEVEDARLAAEVLIAGAAECRRIDLYTRFEKPLEEPRLGKLREWVKRAARHEPIAYLVAEKEFFSLRFAVTPDVLIPRPETETLVEWVIDHCRAVAAPRLLDIGTGSGCIVIACLANMPAAVAVASDVCEPAIALARTNAERHGVLDRLTLVRADRLKLPDDVAVSGFDVVMSNPPYVAAAEIDQLAPGVRDFEPRSALTDEGDGLSFYRDIGDSGASLLRPDGRVFVEIGDGQLESVKQAVTERGKLSYLGARKDRVTGRERVLALAPAGAGRE